MKIGELITIFNNGNDMLKIIFALYVLFVINVAWNTNSHLIAFFIGATAPIILSIVKICITGKGLES